MKIISKVFIRKFLNCINKKITTNRLWPLAIIRMFK
jgi:hypothetical protein